MRLMFATVLMLISVGVAHAQSTLQQNLTAKKPPSYSGNLSLGYNTNLYNPNTYASESSVSGDLTFNYRVKDANLVRAYLGGYKETTQGQEWKPNDGFVGWVNNSFWTRGKKLTIGQQIRANLPYSKESRDRDTKLLGISVAPLVMATLTPSVMVIYLPQVIKNFHSYKQNRVGSANIEYTTSHTLVGIWSITDNIYLQPVAGYSQSWTYDGTRRNPGFSASGEIGYSFASGITWGAGWTNAGSFRRFENGTDQTFELFDNETSTVYTALYWVF